MSKVVLWVSDMDAQIGFYSSLLELQIGERQSGFVELQSEANSVLLHQLSEEYSAAVPLTSQLRPQTEVAVKPIFLVSDLAQARARVEGTFATYSPSEINHGHSRFLDLVDPEGNVIQIEQRI
jgi:catechol 2,3-dioxygenase-like lactoylglutathione lyase family enzyme